MEKAFLDVTQEDRINSAGQLGSSLLLRNDSGRVAPLKNLTDQIPIIATRVTKQVRQQALNSLFRGIRIRKRR